MAFVSTRSTRMILGDYHLSVVTSNATLGWTWDMVDVTCLTDTAKQTIPGLHHSTAQVSGYLDSANAGADGHFDQLADYKAGAASEPFTLGYAGLGVGDSCLMVGVLAAGFTTAATNAGAVTYDLSMETDGDTDWGVVLHALGAETADGSSTGVDNGAASSNGGVAHIHSTAFSGLTSNAVIVEHSTNNSVWATLGTFTTVTGLTSQRLTIAAGTTVNRYLRATWDVTGTGSNTFAVAFARR